MAGIRVAVRLKSPERSGVMEGNSMFDNSSQENAVSYEIFLHSETSPEQLQDLQLNCMAMVLPCLTNYIWQQDPFTLHSSAVSKSPWSRARAQRQQNRHADESAPEHLWGVTRFGDNIEDEWFILWLLNQITSKFTNVSARIWDNDGDFLLIEAAYSLPKWLKPDTSTNRVWLQSGCLHVIPLPSKHHRTLPAAPTVAEALQIISSDSISTTANSGMQEAIKSRIKGYPRKAETEMHRARCTLPAKVAHIVQKKPQLVSSAVQTFHYRDVQDMKAAARLALFPPQDLVTVVVTFNRALYAQLAQQQFQPPRGYPLPPLKSPAFRAAELGMKLTCGFEMVMAKNTSSEPAASSHHKQVDATAQDNPQWQGYLASLTKNGYFKGNIPGSAQYKELMTEASQAFMQTQALQQSAGLTAAPAQSIATILQQPVQAELFKDGAEDDDAWMTGGAADLDAELAKRQKELADNVAKHAKRTAQGLGKPETAPEFDPTQMVSQMKAFVNKVSGHEGAELPHGVDPDVSFDDPAFWRELKSALGVAADKHGLDLDLDSESASSSDGFSDDNDDDSDYSDSAPSNLDSNLDGPDQPQLAEASSSRQPHGMQSNNPGALSSQQHPSVPHSKYGHSAIPSAVDVEGDDASASSSEVLTATDSDDDEAGFMHAYDDALAQELSSSRVGSILHPSAEEGDHQGAQAGVEPKGGNDMKPVDLDTNLVRNLLQSYTAQQGLAGPAGNLAGLLGLNLPDNVETE